MTIGNKELKDLRDFFDLSKQVVIEKPKAVHMSYDFAGFTQALLASDNLPFNETEIPEVIAFLKEYGDYDLRQGLCHSFQLYNQDGVIIFDSSASESSNNEQNEVA